MQDATLEVDVLDPLDRDRANLALQDARMNNEVVAFQPVAQRDVVEHGQTAAESHYARHHVLDPVALAAGQTHDQRDDDEVGHRADPANDRDEDRRRVQPVQLQAVGNGWRLVSHRNRPLPAASRAGPRRRRATGRG